MNHPRSRYLYLALCAGALGVAAAPLVIGCDSKRPPTSPGDRPAATSAREGEAAALAELEAKPDAEHCRTALQQLDNLDSAGARPVLADAERADLGAFLRLTPAEANEAGQRTFSQTDAAYLEECMLVRAGVRSLRIDARPPLERAQLGFDWVCRMVYLDDRWPAPANAWNTLQGGSGLALSRAYVVLAAWQQLGLDGCVVGPPELEKAASVSAADPTDPASRATYAPVRACAVKVGADLFLFDPAAGRAVPSPDGKSPLTLAQAKARPDAAKDLAKADEVKGWQPFLAPSLPGLARRMEWLERLNPGNVSPRLFVDARRQRAEFAQDLGGTAVKAWNPDGDPYSAGRVLARYGAEEPTGRTKLALRDAYRLAQAPLEQLPKINLTGVALVHVSESFRRPFDALRYAPHSARDLILRGQFTEATTALAGVKDTVANARARLDQDKTLERDFKAWADEFQDLSAGIIRAEREDPARLGEATRALNQFMAQPRNQDIERSYVLGHAARPLAADVAFLTATAVHERAERARLEGTGQAASHWRNAAEWWQRFLDASVQAKSPYPARERHAQALLARCKQFTGK
jgi:hypothetical protein